MTRLLLRLATSAAFITLCALAFRLIYLFHQAHQIPDAVLATVPFENEAGNIAQALARGDGFCCLFRQPTGPTAWLAPAYPFFLSLIFRLFGTFTVSAFYCASLLNCVFSAAASVPLYFAGRKIGNTLLAASAAWIWALFPSGIILPFQWIWETSFSALLVATLLYLTFYLADASNSSNARSWLIYSALCGLALLTNPAIAALFPIFFAWIAFQQRRASPRPWRHLALSCFIIFAICLPWTIRNAIYFHRLIPMRDNFPFELWMGNNDIYNPSSHTATRITRFEQAHLYQQQGESAFLDEKGRLAASFIRSNPALFFKLCFGRAVSTWFGGPSPLNLFRGADTPLVRFLLIWNLITFLGMLAGIARLVYERSRFWFPLALVPLIYPFTYYLTQTSLRLRHPIDPVLALLLAVVVAYSRSPSLTSAASHASNQPIGSL